MREDELIALVPTIANELTAGRRQDDLKRLDAIFGDLFGAEKTTAYDALGELEDLMTDISGVPEHSSLSAEEWVARRTDFGRAAELYLDARWTQPSGAKNH
jgi:hypothetical protein